MTPRSSTIEEAAKDFAFRFARTRIEDMIDWKAFRRSSLESSKLTSIGILAFGFGAGTFDYPETLGAVMEKYPVIRRRVEKWANSENDGFPNVITGNFLWWLVRPTKGMIEQAKRGKRKRGRKQSK